MSHGSRGPLSGLKVIEFQSAGPGPFCCMLLADLGADVIRIARPAQPGGTGNPLAPSADADPTARGRRTVEIDLSRPEGVNLALELVATADVLTEGLRPGVMERIGLGPDVVLDVNPRLVYGRITGWGQDGPLAQSAGHDINYIALTGALHSIGEKDGPPVPPLNLVGDYGGGGFLLAFGILAALQERVASGKGQVVDAAMVEGASAMMSIFHGMLASGALREERGSNMLDSGAPFYRTYRTADDRYVAVGAIENKFYRNLLDMVGAADVSREAEDQYDRSQWSATTARLAELFKQDTRAGWAQRAESVDACLSPVLTISESVQHPHHVQRNNFIESPTGHQPSPAPRFSRTPADRPSRFPDGDPNSEQVLKELGISLERQERLRYSGIIK